LIDIGLSPSAKVRAEGEYREFNKNHRDTEFTEKDYAFLWKKTENSIRKWKMPFL
jgi:hypothetical protein